MTKLFAQEGGAICEQKKGEEDDHQAVRVKRSQMGQ
jgi:hypothetical protein